MNTSLPEIRSVRSFHEQAKWATCCQVIRNETGSGANSRDIAAVEARGRAMGISGVPLFVIDNQYALSGAQAESTWADVIRDVMARSA